MWSSKKFMASSPAGGLASPEDQGRGHAHHRVAGRVAHLAAAPEKADIGAARRRAQVDDLEMHGEAVAGPHRREIADLVDPRAAHGMRIAQEGVDQDRMLRHTVCMPDASCPPTTVFCAASASRCMGWGSNAAANASMASPVTSTGPASTTSPTAKSP
jgi:hypothetical protein